MQFNIRSMRLFVHRHITVVYKIQQYQSSTTRLR